MAFRHNSQSNKKRSYSPANDYAKALSKREMFGEKTRSKNRLVTKHVVVSVNRKYWHVIKLDLVITTITTKRLKLLFY